jgi:hypothetical protein
MNDCIRSFFVTIEMFAMRRIRSLPRPLPLFEVRPICTKHMMLAAATATNPHAKERVQAQEEEKEKEKEKEKKRQQEELADDLELLQFHLQFHLHCLHGPRGVGGQIGALTAHIETLNAQLELQLDAVRIPHNPIIDIEDDMTGVRVEHEDIEMDGYLSY